ncbi:hypothetical protein OWV82_010315 [Melia azedarach]|uniref:Uncharacterized protein n=1 Tax=Melia azedarach TaxID=155640 RepID=A0ACC1Y7W1_MELAZ|nr:hypothetical protein OWV82_010315 [Melia azedarach]
MGKLKATVKEYGPRTIAKSIKNKLSYTYQLPSEDCSIFQVQKVLLWQNVSAYAPVLISIGPYHQGKEGLETMEALKLRYLYGLLNKFRGTVQKHITLEDLVSGVLRDALEAYS